MHHHCCYPRRLGAAAAAVSAVSALDLARATGARRPAGVRAAACAVPAVAASPGRRQPPANITIAHACPALPSAFIYRHDSHLLRESGHRSLGDRHPPPRHDDYGKTDDPIRVFRAPLDLHVVPADHAAVPLTWLALIAERGLMAAGLAFVATCEHGARQRPRRTAIAQCEPRRLRSNGARGLSQAVAVTPPYNIGIGRATWSTRAAMLLVVNIVALACAGAEESRCCRGRLG